MLRKKVASTIAPIIIECKECGEDVHINVNKKINVCKHCGAEIDTKSSDE